MNRLTIFLVSLFVLALVLSVGVISFDWFGLYSASQAMLSGDDGGWLLFFLVFISALVDSINPCAISVLLLSIAFLFGVGKERGAILKIGTAYIAAIFLTYMLIGLGIIQALAAFGFSHLAAQVGAVLVIIWGAINLLGVLWPAFPIKLKIPSGVHRLLAVLMSRGSVWGALVLGMLVALTEFPCTGGPYLFILGLLHTQGSFGQGLVYLLFYNAVFVSPLVIVLFSASNRTLLAKAEEWKKVSGRRFTVWTALVMIVLGAFILVSTL